MTYDELKKWIYHSQHQYIRDNADRQWKVHNPNQLEKLEWDEYKRQTYSFIEDLKEDDLKTYQSMMEYVLKSFFHISSF